MRTLQFGSIGDDVRRVQQELRDLGYYTLALDGRFGPGTRDAVMSFQRDNGLQVDGIVGARTYAALGITDTGESSTPDATDGGQQPADRRRMSLHIGVNSVDPGEYNGWDGQLTGCENDATTMSRIATAEGFVPRQLFTAQATAADVLTGIAEAAAQLDDGDIFLLSYAGHGAQVPDTGDDGETDRQDETWVLFDRMLIDDELEQAFSAFRPGVEVVLLSDSCHSGTVYRNMFDADQLEYARMKESFYLDVAAPGPVSGSSRGAADLSFPRPLGAQSRSGSYANGRVTLFREAADLWGGDLASTRSFDWRDMLPAAQRAAQTRALGTAPRRFPGTVATATPVDSRSVEDMVSGAVVIRAMPLAVNADLVVRQAARYAEIKDCTRSRAPVRARGLAISGCQDAQLSQEVGGNGVFTTALKTVWADGSFTGNYRQFHQQILTHMGPTQTPQLSGFGSEPDILQQKSPFG